MTSQAPLLNSENTEEIFHGKSFPEGAKTVSRTMIPVILQPILALLVERTGDDVFATYHLR